MPRSASVSPLLISAVAARLAEPAASWLRDAASELAGLGLSDPAARQTVQIRYSQAVRHAPRQPLALTEFESAVLARARPGLDCSGWTLDQAARAALLAALPGKAAAALVTTIDQIAAAADLHELIALYQALPLLPQPKRWAARAAEGVRSNMRVVFAAVATANPYPAEHLDDEAWNQLVLKCLFVGEPLFRVVGLDERRNPELTEMLVDYADERWAAKRPIPPGLWRCVALCADSRAVAALKRALTSDDTHERDAARLALSGCAHPSAKALSRANAPVVRDWAMIETPSKT